MLSFYDWIMNLESSPKTRALNAPWAYPALYIGGNVNSRSSATPQQLKNFEMMVRRDTKKKVKKKIKKKLKRALKSVDEGVKRTHADHSFDDTVREIELLKSDLQKLASKKADSSKKPAVKRPSGGDELLNLAKVALSNLKNAPDYYNTRNHDRTVNGAVNVPVTGKVSRSDAERVARELGVHFGDTKFSQEAFRKAIEFEFNRTTAFDRESRGPEDESDKSNNS